MAAFTARPSRVTPVKRVPRTARRALPLPTTPHPDLAKLPKRHGLTDEQQAMVSTLLWDMQARVESAGVKAARDYRWCDKFKTVMAEMFPGGPRHGSEWRDATGYDCDGRGPDGFDEHGFNARGFNREGYDWQGRDWEGYDSEGYNRNGFNREGIDRDGKRWDAV